MQGKSVVPSKYDAARSTWAPLHPNYDIIVWDEVDLQELIAGTKWQAAIDLCEKLIQRADVYRCAVLETYGGVYIDMDMHAIKSLEPLLDELDSSPEDIAIGLTSFSRSPLDFVLACNNAWIISRAHSRVWEDTEFPELLKRLHIKSLMDCISPVWYVLRTAGPGLWTHLGQTTKAIRLLPKDYFYSLKVIKGHRHLTDEESDSLRTLSYAYHSQESAWLQSWESMILGMFIGHRWKITVSVLVLLLLVYFALTLRRVLVPTP
jgi:mannosyltransferase OCH1-like enzyme